MNKIYYCCLNDEYSSIVFNLSPILKVRHLFQYLNMEVWHWYNLTQRKVTQLYTNVYIHRKYCRLEGGRSSITIYK